VTSVWVLGPSGIVQETERPTDPHAAERFDADIESGDLRIVDKINVEKRESRHGGVVYVLKAQIEEETKPAPRKKAAAAKSDTD
jgi:hypothetical protein